MSDVFGTQGPGPSSSGRLDQFIGGLMFRKNGTSIADERERRVGLEATALGYIVQSFTLPWAIAVAVWVFGRPAFPGLLIVFGAYYVADLARLWYQMRHRVRLWGDGGYAWWKNYKLTAASWVYMAHTVLSIFAILGGVVFAYREEFLNGAISSGTSTALITGGYILATIPAMMFLYFRWSERKNAVESD